jgi:hypothetical protein
MINLIKIYIYAKILLNQMLIGDDDKTYLHSSLTATNNRL